MLSQSFQDCVRCCVSWRKWWLPFLLSAVHAARNSQHVMGSYGLYFFLFGACCFVIKLDIKRVGDGPSQLYMHIILYISQLPAYVFYLWAHLFPPRWLNEVWSMDFEGPDLHIFKSGETWSPPTWRWVSKFDESRWPTDSTTKHP